MSVFYELSKVLANPNALWLTYAFYGSEREVTPLVAAMFGPRNTEAPLPPIPRTKDVEHDKLAARAILAAFSSDTKTTAKPSKMSPFYAEDLFDTCDFTDSDCEGEREPKDNSKISASNTEH